LATLNFSTRRHEKASTALHPSPAMDAAPSEGFFRQVRGREVQGWQSNPTFLLRDARRKYVLRRKAPGKLFPAPMRWIREYR